MVLTTRETLGVDIGGVIIARTRAGADTSFGENYLDAPEVPGALDVIAQLVGTRFGRRVFLISKCGPRHRAKSLRWLKHHRFFERTGLRVKDVRFCMERSEKAPICRDLGVTHFVDDRLDVLLSLNSVPYRFLLDVSQRGGQVEPAPPRSIRLVRSWTEIARALVSGPTMR